MASYGIPYMGSKDTLIHKLSALFPKASNFYDLFGGGFSVSHFMVLHHSKKYNRIVYNEIKSDVVGLVRDAIAGKYNYNVFKPKWISREEFAANKDKCAYTRLIWSFGNNQRDYLFGEENELNKKSLHNAVVFNEFDALATKLLGGIREFPKHLSIRGRRLLTRTIVVRRMGELQQLEQLEQLERLQQLERLERLQQLQQLQQLLQLERLQQLQQLQQLELTSQSYDQVPIFPNSVIYCDPPYKGTSGYVSAFDHDKFWDWAMRQTEPVFVSEYTAPPGVKTIAAFHKNTRLSGKGSTGTAPEKLFGNAAAVERMGLINV